MKLLLCLCTLTCSTSFTTLLSTTSRPTASVVDGRRVGEKTIQWIGVNDDASPQDDTTADTVVPNDSSSTSSSSPGGSDLKSLLPTAKRTTLTLDKFGRRIHDLKSDGTPKYSKGDVSSDMLQDLLNNSDYDDDKSAPMKSDHDITNTKEQQEQNEVNSNSGGSSSPSLAQLVGGKSDGSPTTTSGRSNAAVNNNSNNDAILGEGNVSVDLKALLPTQKMKFMKLDKFGRRIQRMEDDGTVNYSKEPSSSSTTTAKNNQPSTYPQSSSKIRGTKDGFDSDSEAPMVDLGEDTQEATTAARTNNNYGSLKELTTSIQRPTWTKLDFKGGSVVDERRMQQMNKKTGDDTISSDGGGGSVGGGGGGGKSLQELLPKRATWTKLDFKGVPVEDERRTKKQSGSSSSSGSSFNQGGYSSLKTLLPTRTITWHKNQVLSSGSAPTLSQVSRGLREERQQAMKDEVIASISAEGTNDDEDDDGEEGMAAEEDDSVGEEEEEVKAYQNLKDLLPQRKVTWRTTK